MLPVSSDAASRLSPVDRSERLVTVDVLRGLALLGVIIANMTWFSGVTFRFPAYRAEILTLSLDSIVYHAINVIVSGKAIATLSFLFGLGFSIQMLRARTQRASALPLYCRRLLVLLALGLIHTVFLWYGDILTLYALLGFILILFVHRSDRFVLVSSMALIAAVPIAVGLGSTIVILNSDPDAAAATAASASANAATLAVFQSGSYGALVRENIAQTLQQFGGGVRALLQLQYLGLFLLGFVVGRNRLFERVADFESGFRRVAAWGLAVGLASSLVRLALVIAVGARIAFTRSDLVLLMYVLTIGTIVQAAGYVAAVTLLLRRPFWQRCLTAFVPAGRMALTNYLTQTVVCLMIFYGFGGGLVGRAGPALCLLIALAIYATQMVFSALWLSRFRMGPMEWLWRSATYGRLQPFVLEPRQSLTPVAHV